MPSHPHAARQRLGALAMTRGRLGGSRGPRCWSSGRFRQCEGLLPHRRLGAPAEGSDDVFGAVAVDDHDPPRADEDHISHLLGQDPVGMPVIEVGVGPSPP